MNETEERGRVLVLGATGNQGGAVARSLLSAGWPVRAVTRNPDKPAARALKQVGAELISADMNVPETLGPALEGCESVFSVQNYWEKGVGFTGEVRQGKALAASAKSAGVRHFIQSSVANGRGPEAGAPEHFRCKWEIEKYVDSIDLPWTLIRTVFFYDLFLDPKKRPVMFPLLAGSLRADLKLHGLVLADLGMLVRNVLGDRERYLGQTINVASDILTVDEMKAIYASTTKRKAGGWKLPPFVLRLMNPEIASQFRWNNADGWVFDLDEVREHLANPTSFEKFCRDNLA